MNLAPTFRSGIALSQSDSAMPEMWKGLVAAYVPAAGYQGSIIRDLSINKNNGHAALSSVASSSWKSDSCRFFRGSCVEFNGSSAYANTGRTTSSLGIVFDFSVIAVAKNDGSLSTREGIVSCYNTTGADGWALRYENGSTPSNGLVFSVGDWSTGAYFASSGFDHTDWNHFAGVKRFTDIQAFVNGSNGTGATASIDGTANNIDIAADFNRSASRYWGGRVALVLIYNKALSDSLIKHHSEDPFLMFRKRTKKSFLVPAPPSGQYSDIFNSTIFGGSVIA